MMKRVTLLLIASILFLIAGCQRPAVTSDTTPPDITVFVSRGRGRNIFRSMDGELKPPDNCIKVPELPTQIIMIAGDAGGIQFASINTFPGSIVPGSVEVTPRSPEGTFSITNDRGRDILTIRLAPPAPGTVRTGATAVFDVTGSLPTVISASAQDYAGHRTVLPQFDLRALGDGLTCRGGID